MDLGGPALGCGHRLVESEEVVEDGGEVRFILREPSGGEPGAKNLERLQFVQGGRQLGPRFGSAGGKSQQDLQHLPAPTSGVAHLPLDVRLRALQHYGHLRPCPVRNGAQVIGDRSPPRADTHERLRYRNRQKFNHGTNSLRIDLEENDGLYIRLF